MELLEKYQLELAQDVRVDEINLTDTAYKLPALKHKWVARLINAKIELNKLEKQRSSLKESVLNKLQQSTEGRLSKIALSKSVDDSDEFIDFKKKLDDRIEENKMIILYLEKAENIFKNMTYDLKNIIDLNKLETT
jgi:hypothetical protein